MGIILTILATLACVIAALLILALCIPRHYSVTVSQTISKPKEIVFDYVSLLKNQLKYSEWLKSDTTLQSEITGIDGTVGATLKWDSNNPDKNKNVGKGEQEITHVDSHHVDIELRLIRPMPVVCKLKNHFIDTGSGETLYTSSFHAYAKYPVNLPSYVIGRHFIRKAQQKTLNNIKSILEKE